MGLYPLSKEQITDCLRFPDIVLGGSENRAIAQKRLNGYLLRVVFETENDTYLVITAYKAKRERYEIQI